MISEQTRNKLITIAENEQKVYDNGVADGKQAENDVFWDVISYHQTRTDYQRAFRGWACQYIRPPFKITPTARYGDHYMFADNKELLKVEKEFFDLSQLKELSQTSNSYGHMRTFSGCMGIVEIEDIGMPSAAYDATFYDCVKLEKIEVVRSQEDTFYNLHSFGYCSKLQHLVIEGVIGTDFNIKWSPLSVASLKSIIKHLAHYYGTDKEFTRTLTVKASAWQALEDAGFTNEDYQWIFDTWGGNPTTVESWDQLMGGWLGWNLVLA